MIGSAVAGAPLPKLHLPRKRGSHPESPGADPEERVVLDVMAALGQSIEKNRAGKIVTAKKALALKAPAGRAAAKKKGA